MIKKLHILLNINISGALKTLTHTQYMHKFHTKFGKILDICKRFRVTASLSR